MLDVSGGAEDVSVEVSISGQVMQRQKDRAVAEVMSTLAAVDAHVLHLRVRLDVVDDPARERPASARIVADVNGDPIRVHVTAPTIDEAVDMLGHRLRARVVRAVEHRRAIRRRHSRTPGSWHHGDLPAPRPPHHPMPAGQREVVRHKTYTATMASVEEAIHDLESMDYDFFLFTDVGTSQDAVVQRLEDGTYRLQLAAGAAPTSAGAGPATTDVVVDGLPAPTMDAGTARDRLEASGEPFVFFLDEATGRGRVLYHRYDGHYGLITPADAGA